jgi:hypothetical protein
MNKENSVAIGAGVSAGLLLLLVSQLFFSVFEKNTSLSTSLDESVAIKYSTTESKDTLLNITLTLFGFDSDDINDLTKRSDGLLSEDVTVRIVAQAKVGDAQKTILEVISANETSRLLVQEGSVVNGLLIKSITDKNLVVEKDTVEHIIKLFHSKELKSTKIEQTNDTP